MGWISRKNEKGSYVARYRDPGGREHSKSFRTRTEARAFLNSIEDAKQRGDWTDPAGSKVKLKEYTDQYVAGLTHVRAGTKQKIEGHLNNQILPIFGAMPLGAIRPTDIRAWVAQLAEDGLPARALACIERSRRS